MTLELIDFRVLIHVLRLEAKEERFSKMRVVKQYRLFTARARQRRQLSQMPDYLLKDIGISRADAMQEADKPFWLE
jgi:uncharacterized protein YjiS (DUF1127 family)